MTEKEEYFPRGGKKTTVPKFTKRSTNFLGNPIASEKKRKPRKEKRNPDDGYLSNDSDQQRSKAICSNGISYSSVQRDTLLLGRVTKITETKVHIALPCRMSGVAMACHINETYNKILNAYVNDQTESVPDLSELFYQGQYVATKVLEVNRERERTTLMLSLMPQHINSHLSHIDVQKGLLFQVAVSSVEDHGYVVDLGIPNTRAFLKKSDVDEECTLAEGHLTWCTVTKVTTDRDATTVSVTSKIDALKNSFIRADDESSDMKMLLPGVLAQFHIDEALDTGIEGRVLNNQQAFIQRYHISEPRGKKPKLGQKVIATLLYIMPTTKTPFFTMKPVFERAKMALSDEQVYKEGDIVEEATVIRITGRSVYLRLEENNIGFISMKKFQVDEELPDADIVAKSYPLGHTLSVRITSYHPCDFIYSCSDEASMLQQKYFTYRDVNVGDFIEGKVTAVHDNSVHIAFGRLKGIIPKMHLSDVGVYQDPKKESVSKGIRKKFKEGQTVKARVQMVDLERDLCLLTMKQTFLDPTSPIIINFDDAVEGQSYKGFIRNITDNIIVGFFNGVTAVIPKKEISREHIENIHEAFHTGQIVSCTIIKVNKELKRLYGSLIRAPYEPTTQKRNQTKRKNSESEYDSLPEKKNKQVNDSFIKDNKVDIAEKKAKKRSNSESDSNVNSEKRKDKKRIEELKIESEQSDAIETDIGDDDADEKYLTFEEMLLTSFADCSTQKEFKKRVISLKKSINSCLRRVDSICKKIDEMEEKGVTVKTKIYHSSMHLEKAVVEKRMRALMKAFTQAQERLKEFPPLETVIFKKSDLKKGNITTDVKLESKNSDANDTSAADDNADENVLTSEDLMLINLDDCVTQKNFKKRVISLKKSINSRMTRVDSICKKIDEMKKKGLTPKSKKILTNMQVEKALVEKRIQALMEAFALAQQKLNEFPSIEPIDFKRKKKHSQSEDDSRIVKSDDETTAQEEKTFKKKDRLVKNIETKKINVLDDDEPGLEVPNFKDFYVGDVDSIMKHDNKADDAESSSSDEELESAPKKKRKRQTEAEKIAKARQEEERLREIEKRTALDENTPQSSDQFERLLLANPNSSELWIAYMAFYLQTAEVEKARAVGRKALQTISFREEREKLNVWLAMLNFEHRFGTKDSQKATLDEALQMNDTFEIHSKMLDVYVETNQHTELISLVNLMLKKYNRNPKTYILTGEACFKVNNVEKARSIMQKAISVLDKKEHIAVIVKFAKLEAENGDGERGEALLEQIVGSYPQRVDVWSVYIDMLYANQDYDNIRRVLERAVSHKLPAKKMKSLYKKWIEIEEKLGNNDQIERIRKMAMDFIEKAKF